MSETVLMTGKEASLVAEELIAKSAPFEAKPVGDDTWEFTVKTGDLPYVLRVVS